MQVSDHNVRLEPDADVTFTRGEKALLVAMLEHAVLDLKGRKLAHQEKPEEVRADVIEWIRDDAGDAPFTFYWICEMLGVNYSVMRNTFEELISSTEKTEVVITLVEAHV